MRNLIGLLIGVISLVVTAGTALAVSFPWLDYTGTIDISTDGAGATTLDQDIFALGGKYLDGSTFTPFDGLDSISGKEILFGTPSIVLSGSNISSIGDTTFSIMDGLGSTAVAVFSADLVNIVYLPYTDDFGVINPTYSANLQNVAVNNSIGSRWLSEIATVAALYDDQAATQMSITFGGDGLSELIQHGYGSVNINGKIAPVPEPGTMLLLGAGFLGLAIYGKRRKNA